MPTSLGPAEILVILVVALVVLGPKRLPEAGRQIGRFVAEVRHWSSAVQAEIRDVIDAEGEPQPPPPTAAPSASLPPAQPAPVPTPEDLGSAGTPAPAPAPPRQATGEWGLPERAPTAPQPAAAPGSTARELPPEWTTKPSTNGDHS